MSQPRSPFKTRAEMDRIREANAILRAEEIKNFVPESNTTRLLATFEIHRYVTGQLKGMFVVTQVITDDGKGNRIKPIRKQIIEGVNMDGVENAIGVAARRRVFK
jgi:hypothetical protein